MVMMASLDPGLLRDLTEVRADLARHGIVIVRTVETELEPAIMALVKSSMASSPKKMSRMGESALDSFVERLRKSSEKDIEQLRDLYVRLLAKLGSEPVEEIIDELDGIEQLFRWERIAKTVEQVNEKLAEKGFGPIELAEPEILSEGFQMELEQKWPASFDRFRTLAKEGAARLARKQAEGEERLRPQKTKKPSVKG